MSENRIYFSITVRDSPYSKDLEAFMKALDAMGDKNNINAYAFSKVLPYHGTAGKTGIVYGEIENNLTPEQREYFKQFAYVYNSKADMEAAKAASFKVYCDLTPDPG